MPHESAIAKIIAALGPEVVQQPAQADLTAYLRDYTCKAPADASILALARPRSTEEVSALLRQCHEMEIPIVPQGGLTGLAGGAVPNSIPAILLSLERMRAVLEIDKAAGTMTVQAGVPLEAVQSAADEAGFMFPLDLGGRGTARIGGNAATNAGGNRVLRYGMMRDLVLGLEAVLADGTIIRSLNKMIKNNAGYDLKHLFLGTEGTLGVITTLVLRLFPRPLSTATGMVAVQSYAQLLSLLQACQSSLGGTLTAFEAMWPEFYALGTRALGRTPPLPLGHEAYVLIEMLGTDPETDPLRFERLMERLIAEGTVEDAIVAQSGQQTQNLWAIRDLPGELQATHWWPQTMFDVSIPIGQIGDFITACKEKLEAKWPGVQSMYFGHIADSNLHLSVKSEGERFGSKEVEALVYALVGTFGGSISAEHGIGTLKKDFLHYSRTAEEIALMQTLKQALDPKCILNPGKVI